MLCVDGRVELQVTNSGNDANGYHYTEGLVYVCINETYGAICDEGLNSNAAAVVCSSIGYGAPYHGMYSTCVFGRL